MSTVVRWNPFRDMVNMRSEFDRLFDEVMDAPRLRWQEPTNWGLALDVVEDEENFMIKASVPGVDPNDLDITITDNVLTIKGEIKEDETVEQERYHLRERRFGTFARSVTLPVPVNADAIEATYEHGILNLYVPKTEEIKPKRIAIKTANGTKVLEAHPN